MAARTSTSLGVGIAVTLLGIASLGLFVTTIIMWSQASSQKKRADEQETRTAEFIREDERGRDQVVRLKEAAKKERKSLVTHLIDVNADLMNKVTGSRTDTFPDIDKKFKDGEAPLAGSLLAAFNSQRTEIASLKSQLEAAVATADRARQDKETESKRVKAIDDNMNKTIGSINADQDAQRAEVEKLRKSIEEYRAQSDAAVQTVRDEARAKETALQSEVDNLQRSSVLDKSLIQRLQDELKGKRFVGRDEYALVDATVIGLNPADGTATINVGSKKKAVIGLRFEVYSDATAIRPDDKTGEVPVGKATVEIISVQDDTSTVRILREKRGNPIVRGDVMANAVYDPAKQYTFVVYGNFDSNRDGRATQHEQANVRAQIQAWDGKVIDDLSGEVDFLVLGERPVLPPEPSGTAPVEVVDEWIRLKQASQRYDELFKKATETSIPVLNENRLRTLIGDNY